jgi:hypothetical protein
LVAVIVGANVTVGVGVAMIEVTTPGTEATDVMAGTEVAGPVPSGIVCVIGGGAVPVQISPLGQHPPPSQKKPLSKQVKSHYKTE